MTNEIVATLKGRTGQDPWIVVHAEDPQTLDHMLDSLSGDLLARIHGLNEIFQNVQAAAPLAPPPVSVQQPQPAAPAAPTGWQAPEVPSYQPPAAAPPSAPTTPPAGNLPAGVTVWVAPNSKKPEYNSVYFSYPFIADAEGRKALQERFKNEGWAKPVDTNAKPWVYEASKNGFSPQLAESIFAQFASLFG